MATSSLSRAAIRRLPLFMAYCPDAPNALPARLEVRPAHFKRWAKDRESGRACTSLICPFPKITASSTALSVDRRAADLVVFGLGYLPPQDSPLRSAPVPAGIQPMAGSLLIFHSESLETAWDRLKEDEYYTAGVWDKDKMVVNEFISPPEGYLYGAESP